MKKLPSSDPGSLAAAAVHSVAIKCFNTEKMVAFYSEAFQGSFRDPVQFGDMTCYFGQAAGLTLKLVSGREGEPDFEGYPVHQFGVAVPDVSAVLAVASKHGGRPEGGVQREGDQVFGCVRDPDGNTIELAEAK